MPGEQRRLAAIVSADVVGYSRLMGRDESGTLAALKALRREVVDPKIKVHRGRIVKTTGDGLLLEFSSIVDAMRCVEEVQTAMAARNADVPADRRIEFRIGVNIGDIIIDGKDIFGDGVNVAARLQELAAPGGICVSGRVQEDVRDKLDMAFEDAGEQQLKNIARPVRVYRLRASSGVMPATAPSLALPDKPSIAVLPFQNMSGDPDQEYFADGVVEDIITALSRFRSLFVIARNSSFTYKGRAVDVKQVGRELGVQYVLEGSVRRAGGRLRITGQLIDALRGAHLWADRFDGVPEDVFGLQDQVTEKVVAAIAPKVEEAEIERARRKPTADLTAYDLYLRALPHYHAMTGADHAAALPLLEAAVTRNPAFAQAVVMLARTIARGVWQGWQADHFAAKRRAEELARQALALDSADPLVLAMAGYVLAVNSGEHDFGETLLARAIELNPNLADGWAAAGWAAIYNGQLDLATDRLVAAERLDPLSPDIAQVWHGRAAAHYFARQFGEAVAGERRAVAAKPMHAGQRSYLVAALAGLGDLEAARAEAAALLQLQPSRTLRRTRETNHYRYAWMMDMYLDGLRQAGIPE